MYSPHMGQVDLLAQQAQADEDARVQQALDTMYLITGAAPPNTASTSLPELTVSAPQTPWLLLALIVGYWGLTKTRGGKLWR